MMETRLRIKERMLETLVGALLTLIGFGYRLAPSGWEIIPDDFRHARLNLLF